MVIFGKNGKALDAKIIGEGGVYKDHTPTMTVKDTGGESVEEDIEQTILQHNTSIFEAKSLEETTKEAHDYYKGLSEIRKQEGELLKADEYERKAVDAFEDYIKAKTDRLQLEQSKKNWESKLSNLKRKGK